MTREQAEALGRRALAAGWVWSWGAMYHEPDDWGRWEPPYGPSDKYHPDTWPDFRDAATCGILLEQVREAWGGIHCEPLHPSGWRALAGRGFVPGDTEPEALVAALEAAPKSALAKSPTDAPS